MNTSKKAYYKMSTIGSNGKTNYLHLFTGQKQEGDLILIEKSLIRMGKKGARFPEPGKLSSSPRKIEVAEMMKIIISMIFEGEFDIDNISHIKGEL